MAHGSLLLLPKWEGGLDQKCPKNDCPPFKPSELFWKSNFWNQQEKLHYIQYLFYQSRQFQLKSISTLVCTICILLHWKRYKNVLQFLICINSKNMGVHHWYPSNKDSFFHQAWNKEEICIVIIKWFERKIQNKYT